MAARLSLVLSESNVNIVNNTSVVTAKLYYYGNGASYNYNNPKGTITIDGTPYSFNHDFTKSTSAQLLATKSKTVTHNADGSKLVSVSASFSTGVSIGTLKTSATLPLTKIARASNIALDKTSVLADGTEAVVATVTKMLATYTDIVTVSLGGYSQTFENVEGSITFAIPEEWINAISSTSATATAKVTSYSGETVIGSNNVNLTVNVPESIVPVINSIDIAEAVAAVTDAFGDLYAQNLSQLNVSIDASGAYGSTIKSYSTALDGVNYTGQAFISNVIKTTGTLSVTVKITDSRGRTANSTAEVDVIAYEKPAITSMAYIHCDSDGNQDSSGDSTKISVAGIVYSVEEQNTKALKLKYKSTTDEAYTERIVDLSDWTFSVDVIINATDPSMTYEYIAELTDKINADSPTTARVVTGIVTLSRLAGGKGVTLFEEASEEGFVVGGGKPAKFTGDMYIEVDSEFEELYTSVFGSGGVVNIFDMIFHIGYVIPTTNSKFDPNILYPWQTWERYAKGQTLVGVNEDDATFASAGLTGGEETHKLTVAEMPLHNHTATLETTAGKLGGGSTYSRFNDNGTPTSGIVNIGNTGGGEAHNNLQPYTTVYYWRRTA